MQYIQTFIMHLFLYYTLAIHFDLVCKNIIINPQQNVLEQLENANIWKNRTPLKLHLGCGESHLNGYVNLDFPPSEHTIQMTQGADAFADITKIKFPAQSVDEIRSHHVFEHFDRQTALALACKWFDWLKVGGTVIIETPDFQTSIALLLDPRFSYIQKQSIMRHVFGSHEASWAIHCDGWYKEKFEHILSVIGFENITFEFTHWQLTVNIIVRATKRRAIPATEVAERGKSILRESMVDQSSSEEKMWQLWCNNFDKNF